MVFEVNATWCTPQQLQHILAVAADTINDDICAGMLHVMRHVHTVRQNCYATGQGQTAPAAHDPCTPCVSFGGSQLRHAEGDDMVAMHTC